MSKPSATPIVLALALSAALAAPMASAQTIERAKLSDGDMGCAQIYSDIKLMDMMASSAGAQQVGANQASIQAANQAGNDAAVAAGSQMLNALVQQGGARAGIGGGLGSLLGGLMGGGGGAQAAQGNPAQFNLETAVHPHGTPGSVVLARGYLDLADSPHG